MSFIPEDYKPAPTGGGYLKLSPGENRFRILGSFKEGGAIMGTIGWKEGPEGPKPVRSPLGTPLKGDFRDKPKEFWAFIVWGYEAEAPQILEITQTSIRGELLTLFKDEEWGDPRAYDIRIVRTGDGMDTVYKVVPSPAAKFAHPEDAKKALASINISALFEGDDPFAGGDSQPATDPF